MLIKIVAVHTWTQTRQIRKSPNEDIFYVKSNVSINHLKTTLRNMEVSDIIEDDCRFYFNVKDFLVSKLSIPLDS